MKKLLSHFLPVLIIAIMSSCNREDPGGGNKGISLKSIPQDVKDFCYFKENSYWIYQDSLSGLFDTVVVESASLDTVNYLRDGKLLQRNELFDVVMRTSFDGYYTHIYDNVPTPPENNNFWVYMSRYITGDVKGETYFQLYPYKEERRIGALYDTMYLILNSPTVKIYEHHRHPGFDHAYLLERQEKNIGVTRREIWNQFSNKRYVWKLVDHEVYQ